ncbi:hypothetical protein [Halobacterium noricense]|uniref:hypothetical protein n=1 Tax=Halobacterium noricense TaxID=223182 RepID=UPI001E2B0E2D|nr:hypothetical protein [Halobacterium noricense]UHH26447.1 hypothetical protein LT974_05795 [Halobacterium noricense]
MFGNIGDELTKQTGAQMFNRFKPQMQALSQVVAQRERAQLEHAQRLADASNADVSVDELPDIEARAAQLETMAERASQADLVGWYFEEFAPDHLDNPEKAVAYAGLNDDEWQNQKEAWAKNYRSTSPEAEAYSDEDLAGLHVENTFGVPLEEFEANVVDFRPSEAIQDVLTTNLRTVEAVMATVAEDMEGEA